MTEKSLKKVRAPKQYTEAEFALKRSEAEVLFISGMNPDDIDTRLGLRKGRTKGWAKAYNWVDSRNKAMERTSQDKLAEILKRQAETFEDLRIIRDKAIDAIETDEVVPKKFAEASSAYLNAVEVERRLKTEALQVSFIADVARVLKDKIQDKDLLFEIAESLKEVFNKYQSTALVPEDKIIE
jgi:hypothetical protein